MYSSTVFQCNVAAEVVLEHEGLSIYIVYIVYIAFIRV